MAKASKPKAAEKAARKGARAQAPGAAAARPLLTPAPHQPAGAPESKLVLTKKSFVERVMIAAGVNKGQARQMTDSVLSVFGAALSKGEDLHLPPLGKLKINRQFDKNGDEILVLKLRRPAAMLAESDADEKTLATPLAEPEN